MEVSVSTQSCDAWIVKGLAQSVWFPDDVYCLQLMTHEPCPTMLFWLQKIWAQQGCFLQSLTASEISIVDLHALLEMFSLQPVAIIVIHMDIEPSRTMYQRIMECCATYQGPYRIVITSSSQQKGAAHKLCTVEVPKQVDFVLFTALYALILGDTQDKNKLKTFWDQINRFAPKLTVSQACLVIPYSNLLGRGKELFFGTWLAHLIEAPMSLFTLSQHLFARDARSFYATWASVQGRYPDEFWLAYWPEQFWRAYNFVLVMRTVGPEQAAVFSKGLPFSFIQRGWRLYQPELFVDLLEIMYDYDCRAKQGGLIVPYERLFHKILVESSVVHKR